MRIEGVESKKRVITSGVPRGSVLGPPLFLLYIYDLPNVVFSALALLFADDPKLINRTSNGALTELQDLHNLHCWSIQNCLLFKYNKCSNTAFTFRNSANLSDLTLGEKVMKHRREIKDLGFNQR